jgi:hypothetical protein
MQERSDEDVEPVTVISSGQRPGDMEVEKRRNPRDGGSMSGGMELNLWRARWKISLSHS